MSDSLSNAAKREKAATLFLQGVPLVNEIFKTAVPEKPAISDFLAKLHYNRFGNPDVYFSSLYEIIYQPPWTAARHFAVAPADFIPTFDRLRPEVAELDALSEAELLARVVSRFTFRPTRLSLGFKFDHYVWAKINHGYWEHLTVMCAEADGRPYYRDLTVNSFSRYEERGFNALLFSTLSEWMVAVKTDETIAYGNDPLTLALSFNAGTYPTDRDLRTPLVPATRGAMVGSLAFFNAVGSNANYLFSDGAAAKALVFRQEAVEFFDLVRANSDVLVFIAPASLRGLRLRDWSGPTENIVVPTRLIHELWPVVLPYVAGALLNIIARHKRVTILTQAGVMSAVFAFLAGQLPHQIGSEIRYFDLGQVLDGAIDAERERRLGVLVAPWKRHMAHLLTDFPLYLAEEPP